MAGTARKRKRHKPEEIVVKRRQVDERVASGRSVGDAAKAMKIPPRGSLRGVNDLWRRRRA